MRHIAGLVITVLVGLLLTYTLTQTLRTYNLHVRILAIADEKDILESVTHSPLKKVEGDVFTFEKGQINFEHKTYNITGVNEKFKYLNVSKKNIDSVKINTKTNVNKKEFESNRLYAITYTFNLRKDVYQRLIMVYCNDYERTR